MIVSRRAAIIRLLQARHAFLEPARRVEYATRGFVHDTLAPQVCPTCEGVDDRCADCHGRGSVEVRRRRDPYAIDKVQPYGLDPTRHEHARDRDAEIQRLAQQTAPPKSEADLLAEANQRDYTWLDARRRWHLAELERALDGIRHTSEPVWHALHALRVGAPLFEAGIVALDLLLPDPLKAPTPQQAPARDETRDERIARLVLREGVPTADVAASEHLSVRQVQRIVNQDLERSDAA